MKKSILALTLLTVAFVACKKKTTSELTPTDVTGTTTVQGVCTKNVISPNGAGGWINTNTVPAAGVLVQIKVNKNQLYPNSVATGADVYSATTGTNGVWSMSVKSNATGVQAYMTMTGFNGTQDTLINNQTPKTGLWANYFGPNPTNLVLVMGTTYDYGLYQFTASNLTSNPNNFMVGSAIVSGSVSLRHVLKTVVTGTAASTSFGFTNTAIPDGAIVYMTLANDPTTLAPKMYQATTTAGRYLFTFPTVASGTPGFAQNGTIWVSDRAGSQDTVSVLNGANNGIITGLSGVHQSATTTQNGLFNNEIRNATNIAQNAFTPN
jgi:hypothetical protein